MKDNEVADYVVEAASDRGEEEIPMECVLQALKRIGRGEEPRVERNASGNATLRDIYDVADRLYKEGLERSTKTAKGGRR